MASPSTSGMFRSFSYEKSIDEIKAAMTTKISALKDKILDRESRVVRIREEYGITDADLITLLTQAANAAVSNRNVNAPMSYSLDAKEGAETRIIGAGVVQHLVTEKTLIEQESGSIEQLARIVRNLRPVTQHADDGSEYTQTSFTLQDHELDYLGF